MSAGVSLSRGCGTSMLGKRSVRGPLAEGQVLPDELVLKVVDGANPRQPVSTLSFGFYEHGQKYPDQWDGEVTFGTFPGVVVRGPVCSEDLYGPNPSVYHYGTSRLVCKADQAWLEGLKKYEDFRNGWDSEFPFEEDIKGLYFREEYGEIYAVVGPSTNHSVAANIDWCTRYLDYGGDYEDDAHYRDLDLVGRVVDRKARPFSCGVSKRLGSYSSSIAFNVEFYVDKQVGNNTTCVCSESIPRLGPSEER